MRERKSDFYVRLEIWLAAGGLFNLDDAPEWADSVRITLYWEDSEAATEAQRARRKDEEKLEPQIAAKPGGSELVSLFSNNEEKEK